VRCVAHAAVAIRAPTPTVCLKPAVDVPIGEGHRVWPHPIPPECPRTQVGAFAIGCVFALAFVCRSCVCNAHNALHYRHLCEFPRVSERLRYPAAFRDAVAVTYRELYPATRDAWLAQWPEHKRVAILRSEHDDDFLFGCVEASLKREIAHKMPSKARLIQAYRNLATQALGAIEHATFQKALFSVAGGGDSLRGFELYPGIFVAGTSGWSARKLARWADTHWGWHLYERDGERWDSTMQRMHHEIKWEFMDACDPWLGARVRRDYAVNGRFRHGAGTLRYKARGTVKSGHNDTTSGNSLINMLVAANAMRDLGVKGSIIVIGDDLLAACERAVDFTLLAERECAYGIIPTVVRPVDFGEATYASGTWLCDGARHVYVPLLGRLFARQWWTVSPPPVRAYAARRHTIACGMLSLVAGIPLYDQFYRPHLIRRQLDLGDDGRDYVKYRANGSQDLHGFDFNVAFHARYGLTPGDIEQLGAFLSSLPTCPSYVADSPRGLIQRIMERDAPGCVYGHDGHRQLEEWGCFSASRP